MAQDVERGGVCKTVEGAAGVVCIYIYMYVPNQCLHPLHRGLAVIPHPRCIWSPFHGDGHQSLHIQLWHGCMDISLTPTLMGA